MSFSFADSISTYSESWTLIDSATTCWHSCHQQCQSSSKKQTERNSKRLCDTSYRTATQSSSWPIDSSCKSFLIVLYFLKNNTKWHKRKNIQECENITMTQSQSVVKQMCWWQDVINADSSSQAELRTSRKANNMKDDSHHYVKTATTKSSWNGKRIKLFIQKKLFQKSSQKMWKLNHCSSQKIQLKAN